MSVRTSTVMKYADGRWSHSKNKNKRKRTLVQTTPHCTNPRTDEPIKYEHADDSLKIVSSAYWSVGTQENYAYGGHTIYLDSHNPAEEFQSLIDQSWFDRQTRCVCGINFIYSWMRISCR